jgi:hypothetical protein
MIQALPTAQQEDQGRPTQRESGPDDRENKHSEDEAA